MTASSGFGSMNPAAAAAAALDHHSFTASVSNKQPKHSYRVPLHRLEL
jgi:hypothetical protein